MSRVFVAHETALGRPVVVKVLPPELAAGVSTERFKREIQVAARLQHPHIVPLLSAGEMDGVPYFTMPFVEGESLRVRLARRGEMPVHESVRVLREIASALAHAHEHGVVHRDIKPDNVLFSGDVAMVADFGVAKALSASSNGDHGGVTSLGVALGTPAYMAPEQATADPTTDHRADVYAFGVLGYEMLTGQPPFAGRNPSQLLAAHVTEAPEAVARRRPNLPPALAALVMRCLEKRPSDRPQSAAEIVHALDELTTPSGGMPPTGARLQPAEHARSAAAAPAADVRPSGRRWTAIGIGAAVLLLGAAGIAAWRRGAEPGAGSAAGTSTADAARDRRIAVLPFENLGDSADAYFADGMTDAVRGKLTELQAIEVIARASSVQYRGTPKPPAEIARDLGVRYLLTGTVRWAKQPGGASRVQVSPELVEVRPDGTASSRWQQPFDAELADVFRVQGEIAGKVVGAMQVALGGGDQARLIEVPTRNAEAYDAVLRALSIAQGAGGGTQAARRRTIAELERAVRLDTAFAEAWARLSVAKANAYIHGIPTRELAREVREAAERALRLAPDGAYGHRALASYYLSIEVDPQRALAELERALAAAPNDAGLKASKSSALISLGRYEDAARELEAALRLDPRSASTARIAAIVYLHLRRYGEARAAAERSLALAPANLQTIQARVMVELGRGDLAEARRLVGMLGAPVEPDVLVAYFATYQDLGWVLDDAGQRRVLALGPEHFDDNRADWALARAQLHGWRGDTAAMRAWGDTAAREYAAHLREAPEDGQLHALRGLALAHQGRRAREAVAEGERAVALTAPERDSEVGGYMRLVLSRIHLLNGDREKALDVLESLLARPYYLSAGWLRIDPSFATLRGHPRFEKLIAGS